MMEIYRGNYTLQRQGSKVFAIFLAVILLWTPFGNASTLSEKTQPISCTTALSQIFPQGYEVTYQPAQNYLGTYNDTSCFKSSYPSQILPSFQAYIKSVDKTKLMVAIPKLAPERRFFLESLAKLGLSYDETGQFALVKDKADSPPGIMESIPASGMYALALSAAQAEHLVSKDEAIRVLRKIHNTVRNGTVMPRAYGILPHFVSWQKNKYVSLAEYSTVDTALYYHSMLLASGILGQKDIEAELLEEIKHIDFNALTIKDGPNKGFISMGVDVDGATIYGDKVWRHWGGESALVLLLARIAGSTPCFPVSNDPGEAGSTGNFYAGRGFIAEIQSLFYPQFNSERPDALTGQNWLKMRRQLLRDQVQCTLGNFGGSNADRLSLYGFSCGEITGVSGSTMYWENGIKDAKNKFIKPKPFIFPHYILMSSQASEFPARQLHTLELLEREGLFTPWGLVESFNVDLNETDTLNGSLNASFEALSAYHLMGRIDGRRDVIYETALRMPLLRDSMGMFY